MNAWSAAHRGVARRPVLTFMLVSLGAGFLAAIPPLVDSEMLPFGLPLHGVVMSLGAALAAGGVQTRLPGVILRCGFAAGKDLV
jgi:hypothetical protein